MDNALGYAAIALLCAVPGAASAEESASVHGMGTKSCGSYIQAYDAFRPYSRGGTGTRAVSAIFDFNPYQNWMLGYLAGLEKSNTKPLRAFDLPALQVWIYNYCQKNPIDPVVNAVDAFYLTLGGSTPNRTP